MLIYGSEIMLQSPTVKWDMFLLPGSILISSSSLPLNPPYIVLSSGKNWHSPKPVVRLTF
jgi:hypothetical protein